MYSLYVGKFFFMKKLEIEGIEIEAPQEASVERMDEMISFSSKLIDFLSHKAKQFSEENDSSLTLNQIKKVYCHSARLGKTQGVEILNLFALARVNMFLRFKMGEPMNQATAEATDSMTELQLEEVKVSNALEFIDISEAWIPNQSDFEKAQKEIEKNDLECNYEDLEDLYLEYQPIEPTWGD